MGEFDKGREMYGRDCAEKLIASAPDFDVLPHEAKVYWTAMAVQQEKAAKAKRQPKAKHRKPDSKADEEE